MKGFLTVLLVCLGLAIAKAVAVALLAALGLGLVTAVLIRPRETLAFLGMLGLLGLANANPTASIITLGVASVVALVAAEVRRKPRGPLRLRDTSGDRCT